MLPTKTLDTCSCIPNARRGTRGESAGWLTNAVYAFTILRIWLRSLCVQGLGVPRLLHRYCLVDHSVRKSMRSKGVPINARPQPHQRVQNWQRMHSIPKRRVRRDVGTVGGCDLAEKRVFSHVFKLSKHGEVGEVGVSLLLEKDRVLNADRVCTVLDTTFGTLLFSTRHLER